MVTFEPGKDPMHFDQPWTVRWEATAGGLYPGFRGTLAVRADDTYGTSMIELSGVYEPPLGVIGAAFDAVVGSRIAHGTARELLRSLGTPFEDQYRRSEASKAAHICAEGRSSSAFRSRFHPSRLANRSSACSARWAMSPMPAAVAR